MSLFNSSNLFEYQTRSVSTLFQIEYKRNIESHEDLLRESRSRARRVRRVTPVAGSGARQASEGCEGSK
jgi:hypothetical protein